jgi:LysM repeat protein
MDTISRESNSSILPIGGLIAGVLGVLLAVVALFKLSTATKQLALQGDQLSRVESLEAQVRTAVAAAEGSAKTSAAVDVMRKQTNDAFQQVAAELTSIRAELAKAQEAAKSAPRATASAPASSTPVVAGPDEYIVKSGDTGTKIAAANGVSLADLNAVNPGINWSRLAIGQKIKLPKK